MSQFSDNVESYTGLVKVKVIITDTLSTLNLIVLSSPDLLLSDYYAFRPDEAVPNQQRRIIKMCMDAYDKVGIIRNIIDLMGDFGSQGIQIVHTETRV